MLQPTKALVISECYPSEDKPQYAIFLEQQVIALEKLGYQIEILVPCTTSKNTGFTTGSFHGRMVYQVGYHCLRYQLFSRWTTRGCFHQIRDLVKEKEYDLLLVHITSDVVLSIIQRIAHDLKIKVVAQYHGLNVWKEYQTIHPWREVYFAWCRKRTLSKVDAIIGVSDKVCAVIREKLPQVPVYTVYNGVDLERFSPRKDSYTGKLRIVSVGNLIPIKGHDYLIKAISYFDKGETPQVTIIGAGPEQDRLIELSDKLGVRDSVRFLGYLEYDQVVEQMRQGDLFVLPSYYEALGCVYLEAMACEIPVIGVEGQGISEIIVDGQNGLLVPEKDATALYEKIKRIKEDFNFANSVAKMGRETAEQFTWEASARGLDRVYKRLWKE